MQITYYTETEQRKIESHEIDAAIKSNQGAVWIDVTQPTGENISLLEKLFSLHPLAIEDIQNQEQRPKAEEFSDHLFIIVNPVTLKDGELINRELGIFVGDNYIITIHVKPDPIVDEAKRRIDPYRIPFSISETYLLYIVLDTIVDSYFPVLEQIDKEIDELGNSLLNLPNPDMQNQLFRLKRSLNLMWWIAVPELSILNTLTKHDLVFIEEKSKYYLRDIEDHLQRITDLVQISRDSVNGLINLYVSAVSNQLNVAVNRLTIFTIILGVLAVISGFYGMNFEHTFPPNNAVWSVPAIIVGMLIVTVGLYWILRRQR